MELLTYFQPKHSKPYSLAPLKTGNVPAPNHNGRLPPPVHEPERTILGHRVIFQPSWDKKSGQLFLTHLYLIRHSN
jgi:hypothetical protein